MKLRLQLSMIGRIFVKSSFREKGFPEDSKPLRTATDCFVPASRIGLNTPGYEFKRFIRLFPELSDSLVFAGIALLTYREEIGESSSERCRPFIGDL